MKASELRIRNLVFDNEGILSKINGFQPYSHSIRCDELEGCELLIDLHPQDGTIRKGFVTDINSCKPIPLTEEWLLKFGFKNHLDTIWIHWSKESGLFEISTRLPQGSYGLWINGTMGCFEYVHQLQNLFFALTGEELTIKD